MRVAINGWFWDSPTTGSGQYTRRLVEHLVALEADLEITLVVPTGMRQEAGLSRFLHPASCILLSLKPGQSAL